MLGGTPQWLVHAHEHEHEHAHLRIHAHAHATLAEPATESSGDSLSLHADDAQPERNGQAPEATHAHDATPLAHAAIGSMTRADVLVSMIVLLRRVVVSPHPIPFSLPESLFRPPINAVR